MPISSISFKCPHCLQIFTVSSDNAGKRTTCPACKNVFRVPTLSKIEQMADSKQERGTTSVESKPWLLLLMVVVLATITLGAAPVFIWHLLQDRGAEVESLHRQLQEVEMGRLQAEAEVAKQKERTDAAEKVSQSNTDEEKRSASVVKEGLGRVLGILKEISRLDDDVRKRLKEYDQKQMETLVRDEIEPTPAFLRESMFSKSRSAIVKEAKDKMLGKWNEGLDIIRSYQQKFIDMSASKAAAYFFFKANEYFVPTMGLMVVPEPPVNTDFYYDKIKVIYEERVEKSKKAEVKLVEYEKFLPDIGNNGVNKKNANQIFTLVRFFQSLKQQNKLTADAIAKQMSGLELKLKADTLATILDDLMSHGGDWRIGDDPKCPSLKETVYTVFTIARTHPEQFPRGHLLSAEP